MTSNMPDTKIADHHAVTGKTRSSIFRPMGTRLTVTQSVGR
jgi:hypothetical protein